MSASDLLLLPSFSEGMPRVLLEATAVGLPFIASNRMDIASVFSSCTQLSIESVDPWVDSIIRGVPSPITGTDISIDRAVADTLSAYD
jgi:hypothetical protein